METVFELPFEGETIHVWRAGAADVPAVLYVHGATFPSGLSVGHRFDGFAWRDDLVARGFQIWGFDFVGFGRSSRFAGMGEPAAGRPPLGRADNATQQLEAVLAWMRDRGVRRDVRVIAHSWGNVPAARAAARGLVGRLAMFGPIVQRNGARTDALMAAWRPVTVEQQYRRFVEDVPSGEPAVLSVRHFERWGADYLASDPGAASLDPPAVRVPAGPAADIAALWSGQALYDPAAIRCPTLIVRGAWDSLATDADAGRLFEALGAARKWDVKIARATHLAHLEAARFELYAAVAAFLEI